MNDEERILENLEVMLETATQARTFVEGLDFEEFQSDSCLQKAVAMNLVLVGEAASRINRHSPEWTALHSEIPWQQITGMRNRIAHDYFRLNLTTVWNVVQTSLPGLQLEVQRVLKPLLEKYDAPKSAPTPDA